MRSAAGGGPPRCNFGVSTKISKTNGDRHAGATHLLQGMTLEDAWSPQDVDEDGHQPLQKRRVYLTTGVMIQAVAQRGCRLKLSLHICKINISKEFLRGRRQVAWRGHKQQEFVIPVSGVLSRFTTSSIVVPDMAASLASTRRDPLFHPRPRLVGGYDPGAKRARLWVLREAVANVCAAANAQESKGISGNRKQLSPSQSYLKPYWPRLKCRYGGRARRRYPSTVVSKVVVWHEGSLALKIRGTLNLGAAAAKTKWTRRCKNYDPALYMQVSGAPGVSL